MGHSFVCGILPAAAQRRLTAARSGMPIQIPGTIPAYQPAINYGDISQRFPQRRCLGHLGERRPVEQPGEQILCQRSHYEDSESYGCRHPQRQLPVPEKEIHECLVFCGTLHLDRKSVV